MKSIRDIKEQLLGKGSVTSSSVSLATSDPQKSAGNNKPIKAPPPIIPIKPAALRRDSQPTPTEKVAPALDSQLTPRRDSSTLRGYNKPSNGSIGMIGNNHTQSSARSMSTTQNGALNGGRPLSGQRDPQGKGMGLL
jgi:hypothetical protein